MSLTGDTVWRDHVVAGNSSSGKNKPNKAEIRAWARTIEGAANSSTIVKATLAALQAVTPDAETNGGIVLNDATASNNGYYYRDTGAWVKGRGLPDSVAVLTSIGGTANAITASTEAGVNPADVQMIILPDPPGTNTSATVTIALNGGAVEDIKAASGANVAIGDIIAGVGTLFFRFGTEWRQLFSSATGATFDHQGAYNAGVTYTEGQVVTGSDEDWYQLKAPSVTGDDPVGSATGNWLRILDRDAGSTTTFTGSFGLGLAADGVTDDVAALVALEATAEEVIRLKNATYFIGTNYTPGKTLVFSSETLLLTADGVTLDWSDAQPDISDENQHFAFAGSGTGSVVGLKKSHAGWFAGNKVGTTSNAFADLQKWGSSGSQGWLALWPDTYITTDGAAYIEMKNNPTLRGVNRERSRLRFSSSQTRGFLFPNTTGEGGHIEHMGFDRANSLVMPTAGYAVQWQARRWSALFTKTDGLFGGFDVDAPDGQMLSCHFFDTRKSCVFVENVNETQAAVGVWAANSSWITVSGVVGTFTNGETITWAGGSGNIFTDGTNYKAIFTADVPALSSTLTGSTSGATCTLDSVVNGHEDGAIRLQQRCHASKFALIEVSGGDYPLLINGTAATDAGRSLSTTFTSCHFDSAKVASAAVFYAVSTRFLGCWFSSFDGVNQDVYLDNTQTTDLVACTWDYSYRRAISATGTSKGTKVDGGVIADNNASNDAAIPAIQFDAGAAGIVKNIEIGVNNGYGPSNPKIGVSIGVGCEVTVDTVDASACPTAVNDSSGGTAKIRNVKGYKTAAAGSTGVTFDGTGNGSWAHGLAGTPLEYWGRTEGDTTNELIIINADATNIYGKLRNTTSGAAVSGTVTIKWSAKMAAAAA